MNLKPPSSSRISVTPDGSHLLIVVPHANGSPVRYFGGPFLLFWFGIWFAGFSSVVSRLSSGKAPVFINFFLVFWLGGWTLGGAYMAIGPTGRFAPPCPSS